MARAEHDLETVLAFYDDILAKQEFLAGDKITLADLFHLPNRAALMAGKWEATFRKYPNVYNWFTGMQRRETWQKAAAEAKTFA